MDVTRVGFFGGSAGGQSALGALLFHGDFYKAAVADCGCHDNRMDKIWWNEAWMCWPVGPEYAANSNPRGKTHRQAAPNRRRAGSQRRSGVHDAGRECVDQSGQGLRLAHPPGARSRCRGNAVRRAAADGLFCAPSVGGRAAAMTGRSPGGTCSGASHAREIAPPRQNRGRAGALPSG